MTPWASGPLLGLMFGVVIVLVNRGGEDGPSLVKSGVAGGIFFAVLMTAYLLWRRDQDGDRVEAEQDTRRERESHQ